MKYSVILAASWLVLACASVKPIGQRDGKAMFEAKCGKTTAKCHIKASEACNGSYQEIETTDHHVFGNKKFSMIFQCK